MWETGAYGFLSDYLWWWVVLASLVCHAWCFFRMTRSAPWSRLRLVAGNLLVAACLLTFAGTLAETYLRFVSTETDAFGATLTSRRWFATYPKLNSLYYRDVEWDQAKPPGVRRIAFVGDSFTYGWGINDVRDRFTELIQARFDDRSAGDVEVMNVAWVAWDTRQELRAAREVIDRYGADEVVLCYLPNDVETLIPVAEGLDPTKPPKSVYVNTSSSFLLDCLYHRVFAKRLRGVPGYFDWLWDGYADPGLWRRHTRELAVFMDACRDRDVTVRIVLLPFLRTRGERYDSARLHARLRTFFESHGVSVVDLWPVVSGRDPATLVVNSHDPHPNERANRLFADAIWEAFYEKRGS